MITELTQEDFYKQTDLFYIEIDKGIIYNRITDENICTVYDEEKAILILNALNKVK